MWVGPYTQTLAEYERVRVVGQGAFGSAVLYRKRDDGSYVILKAIHLHSLNTKERQLALNEHVVLSMVRIAILVTYYPHRSPASLLSDLTIHTFPTCRFHVVPNHPHVSTYHPTPAIRSWIIPTLFDISTASRTRERCRSRWSTPMGAHWRSF